MAPKVRMSRHGGAIRILSSMSFPKGRSRPKFHSTVPFFSPLPPARAPLRKGKEPHGGCQVNGPKVAKFLDR